MFFIKIYFSFILKKIPKKIKKKKKKKKKKEKKIHFLLFLHNY